MGRKILPLRPRQTNGVAAPPMKVRLVRPRELMPAGPAAGRCGICRRPPRPADAVPCERCGAGLHWPCYWPAVLTEAERDEAERALREAEETEDGSADAFLGTVIILCPGCRS